MAETDVEVALAAAVAGAAVVREMYGSELSQQAKSPTDFATEADVAAEEAIRAVVLGARPLDTFEGEEFGVTSGPVEAADGGADHCGGAAVGEADGGGEVVSGGRRWLVDPICGTLNFAAATPLAAVNVALRTPAGVVAAVSADPIAGELFWTDGQRAWCRRSGQPGASGDVSDDSRLTPSARSLIVDVGFGDEESSVGARLIGDPAFRGRFSPRVLSTTLALAWVAAGRHAAYVTDGWLEGSVHYTAGIALCQAAGCVVTDFAGGPVYSGRGLIVAADDETHQRLVGFIAPHLAEVGAV